MIGVKEEDNIQTVWVEIILKNYKKFKLGNFFRPTGMEAQYGLKCPYFMKLGG